jgi:gamma-glutamyltranspeptidase / glutathione hydrolase
MPTRSFRPRPTAFLAILAILSGAAAADTPGRAAPEPPTAVTGEPGTPVHGSRHMAVTAHPLASRAARDMLRAGGGAIDAAVAAQAVLGLVEPQSSGLGGGAFLLHYDAASDAVTSWDGRETAPATATPQRFLDEAGNPRPWPEAVPGGLSVGVPGVLRMLHEVHGRHGRLDWGALFEPAIALARDGFGVSPRLHALLARMGPEAFSPEARAYFFDGDGEPHPLGHVIRNPAYAETLQRIAGEGPDALYQGDIAQGIVDAVAGAWANPGDLATEDLAQYRAVERPAVCAPYRAHRVCGMGPPSSGGLTVQMTLAMLEGFDLGDGPSPAALHLIGEALDLAFADRDRYIADPDFVAVPDGLLDPGYLAERAALIDAAAAGGPFAPGDPPRARTAGDDETREGGGTSHISIRG